MGPPSFPFPSARPEKSAEGKAISSPHQTRPMPLPATIPATNKWPKKSVAWMGAGRGIGAGRSILHVIIAQGGHNKSKSELLQTDSPTAYYKPTLNHQYYNLTR